MCVNNARWISPCPLYTPPVAPTDEWLGEIINSTEEVIKSRYLEEGEVVTRYRLVNLPMDQFCKKHKLLFK